MATPSALRPLFFTCVGCHTKQGAGVRVTPELHESKAEKGAAEDHRCKACGLVAAYTWDEFTPDPNGALTPEQIAERLKAEKAGDDGR